MTSTAERDVVRRLAAASPLARLLRADRKLLRLVAVPRDHVAGSRRRGDALLAGRFDLGNASLSLAELDFARLGTTGRLAEELQGFSWLRDIAAAGSRDQAAPLVEAIVGRWLVAHGTRIDDAWRPDLWGVRILYWTAYAPYILSSRDSGYRSAVLNTLARGARHLDAQAERAAPGLPRITAWAGVVAAGLLIEGGTQRIARGESGLVRALSSAQSEDGGLISRMPAEQVLLVDRLALLRSAYFAARQALPDTLENAAVAALSALHGVTLGDGALASWQGGHPGEAERLAALVEGCGLRARPLRAARGWGYQRLSALGTIVVLDAAPPPSSRLAPAACASTLAFEMSDGRQRLVVNCGGPGGLPSAISADLARALRTTAAHSTLTIDNSNSTAIEPDGSIGRGVTDVSLERSEENDSSRIEAGHDGYVRRFGLTHRRTLALGNDGKELLGWDRLVGQGRAGRRAVGPGYAIRFHLAPGIEPVPTADGLGAILRSPEAPPWNFRCRGAQLAVEPSVTVDGAARLVETSQLVVTGEAAAGTEVAWQLRRAS